jgi:DNA-binding transcriptional ArsR family regulator
MMIEKVFRALSSGIRRKILAYLSGADMTAGEIAERFDISKPSLSKHLSILENAGLITGEKKGQYIHYSLVEDNLLNTVGGFIQEVCPVARPLEKEAEAKGKK